MDYDPAQISYAELLEVFWGAHRPTARSWSRQYASMIFYHSEEQRRLAEESKRRIEAELGRTVYTEIVPAERFYLAEDYHQKYYLRNLGQLAQEYEALYPELTDFVNSTAVTRVNGYVGGHGTPEQLTRDLGRLGLSPTAQEKLRQVHGRWRP